jgi:hypothetical protein
MGYKFVQNIFQLWVYLMKAYKEKSFMPPRSTISVTADELSKQLICVYNDK